MIIELIDKLIKEENKQDEGRYRKIQLFIQTGFLTMSSILIYGIYDRIIGFNFTSNVNLFGFVGGIFMVYYFYRTNDYKTLSWLICISVIISVWLNSFSTGGFKSPLIPWMILSPIFAFLFLRYNIGLLFSALTFLGMASLYFLDKSGIHFFVEYSLENVHSFYLLSYGGLILMLLFMIFILYARGLQASRDFQKKAKIAIEEKVKELEIKNKELDIARSNAESSLKAKGQFLSAMSHEIRTPMNTIIGITNIMMQEEMKEGQIDNFKILKFSSEGLLALINDILDFSKIDAGKIDIEAVDFNLKGLISDIVNSQKLRAEEKNIEIRYSIDDDIPEMVVGDPTRLGQILNNLIGNAVKFTQKGYVGVDLVSVDNNSSANNERLLIKFTITDTGIGIPKDMTEKIFESFTQAGSYITRRFGGTGLGLAITKKLLEIQNSVINVESEEGKGSIFYFNLEFKRSKIVLQHIPKTAFGKQNYESLKGLKLLLVEDNEANQIIASKFLAKWDVEVVIANNGLEAVEAVVNNGNYDLILMDLQMPYLDGYEATERIRSLNNKLSKIPIIALTASALIDVNDRIILTGMDDYVTKPFIPNELYAKVKKWGGK